jgi:hypothetical protein
MEGNIYSLERIMRKTNKREIQDKFDYANNFKKNLISFRMIQSKKLLNSNLEIFLQKN